MKMKVRIIESMIAFSSCKKTSTIKPSISLQHSHKIEGIIEDTTLMVPTIDKVLDRALV